MNGEVIRGTVAPSFRVSVIVLAVAVAGAVCLVLPPILVLGTTLALVVLWGIFRYPINCLGILLAIMPFHFLVILLAEFFSLPHVTMFSGLTKEIPLLIVGAVLWRRNGFRPTASDWWLAACLMIGAGRTVFDGNVEGLRDDFQFVLPYLVGRVAVLSDRQRLLWARWAVWLAISVSLFGMAELFLLGPIPRTVLYTALPTDLVSSEPGRLPNSFYATGFDGLRAASTMIGPPSLAALCMVALIIWWVYFRSPIQGALLFAGLVSTLTRSAWIGTAVAICILAFRLGRKARLAGYTTAALVAFLALIPILGISDFLSFTHSGQDSSELRHRESLEAGSEYVLTHPVGAGGGKVGPVASQDNANALITESSYLAFSAEYGWAGGLCFVCFLTSTMIQTWKSRQPLAYAATGILTGFAIIMTVLLIHEDFRLACWVWFPIGLAIRQGDDVEQLPVAA